MFVGTTLVCLIGMEWCMFGLTTADGFLHGSLLGPSVLFGAEWNTSITKSQSERGNTVHADTCIERNDSASVELCETGECFLHIQLIGTNVWLPKMHRIPPDVDFESSSSHAKIKILKQSKSALLCCVSHITILPVFTCMMNVKDQTRQAFVTRFCLFCDRTSKFVHRHQNIKSPNTSRIQTFQNVWANCRQFSYWLILFFFELVVISGQK